MKSVFCGGVYAAKNTLRVVEYRSHVNGVARRETQRTFFIKKGRRPFLMNLGLDAPAGEVLLHHQRYLEGDGVVKLPQIQTRQLLDLLQPVHQRVRWTNSFRAVSETFRLFSKNL